MPFFYLSQSLSQILLNFMFQCQDIWVFFKGKLIGSAIEFFASMIICKNTKQIKKKKHLCTVYNLRNDQLHIYVLNHRQNKNKLDFKSQKLGDQNCS